MEALLLHPKYGDRQQIAAFDRTMRERILAVPGVAQVSLATVVPGDGYAQAIIESGCLIHAVDRSFFEVMGIALRAGRWFAAGEDQVGPLTVAVVSERCAHRLADDGDVVGRRVPLCRSGPRRW